MVRRTAVVLWLTCFVAPVTVAQTLRGVVVDPADREVAGVVMQLLDGSAKVVARALSNERGAFHIVAPAAGTYRVRTTRIGFRPSTSDPIVLRAGETVTQRIALAAIAISLDTIRASDRAACRLLGRDSAAMTWAVWEQVRAALTAAQLTTGAGEISSTTVVYDRVLDLDGTVLALPRGVSSTAVMSEPWRSATPDVLRRVGYVVVADGDSMTFRAPDIQVLLSAEFIEDHCLRLMDSPDSTRIGVAFEPTPDRRKTPEIRGTLWLDRRSSELRAMEYGYVNVPRTIEERAGGEMRFVRLRNGMWAISRWKIVMPAMAVASLRSQRAFDVAEIKVTGGDLISATSLDGRDTLWSAPLVRLHGVAYDSLHRAPLSGAFVTMVGVSRTAVTDSVGAFWIDSIMPGAYDLQVHHDELDSIGVSGSAVRAVVLDERDTVKVAVPSLATIWRKICHTALPKDETGLIYGTVLTVGREGPVTHATVVAGWIDVAFSKKAGFEQQRWQMDATADSTGTYALCGVPRTTGVRVRAVSDSGISGFIDVAPLDKQRIRRRDLVLGQAVVGGVVARGAIAGKIIGADGEPIENARIAAEGTSEARTASDGRFYLGDVPAGSQQIEVLAIGMQAVQQVVDVTPLETTHIDLQLLKRIDVGLASIAMLDTNRVTATSVSQHIVAAYEQRRRTGWGVYQDSTTIAGKSSMLTALAQTSGVQIKGDQVLLPALNPPAKCTANIWIDGLLLDQGDLASINPTTVAAIEVYARGAFTPMDFVVRKKDVPLCGSIVVWTKRFLAKEEGWNTMSPSIAWLVLGVIALIIEAMTLNLVFVFVAVAALFAGTTAALGVPVLGQIAAFILAGLVLPAILRPRLLSHLGGTGVMSRTDALIGETALVTLAIDPVLGTGRVVVNGHDWAARSTDPMPVGAQVMVHGADGIVLLVSHLPLSDGTSRN